MKGERRTSKGRFKARLSLRFHLNHFTSFKIKQDKALSINLILDKLYLAPFIFALTFGYNSIKRRIFPPVYINNRM